MVCVLLIGDLNTQIQERAMSWVLSSSMCWSFGQTLWLQGEPHGNLYHQAVCPPDGSPGLRHGWGHSGSAKGLRDQRPRARDRAAPHAVHPALLLCIILVQHPAPELNHLSNKNDNTHLCQGDGNELMFLDHSASLLSKVLNKCIVSLQGEWKFVVSTVSCAVSTSHPILPHQACLAALLQLEFSATGKVE